MKKTMLMLFLTFSAYVSTGQTIETATYSGVKILYPTLRNLTSLASMSFTQFSQLTKQYNYTSYEEKEDVYVSHLPVGSPLFFIKKSVSQAGIMWTDETLNISSLKDELQPYYEESEDGKTFYSISLEGKRYRIVLRKMSITINLQQ